MRKIGVGGIENREGFVVEEPAGGEDAGVERYAWEVEGGVRRGDKEVRVDFEAEFWGEGEEGWGLRHFGRRAEGGSERRWRERSIKRTVSERGVREK